MSNLEFCPICNNFPCWCDGYLCQIVFGTDTVTKENPVSPCEYCGEPSTRIVTPFGSMEVRACDTCGE